MQSEIKKVFFFDYKKSINITVILILAYCHILNVTIFAYADGEMQQ